MFIVQAHSFSQQARLAITLAWVAGYTNLLTILTCGHVTSHVSGTTSDLGRFVADGRWVAAGFGLFLLTTFLVGAAISGFATEIGKRLSWESIYVLPMAIEALLLATFALTIEFAPSGLPTSGGHIYLMTGLASCAMGLQNATITRISSGVVRTTHVTGVLTDLGLELALFLCWLFDALRKKKTPSSKSDSAAHSPAPPNLLIRLRTHSTTMRLALLASIIGSFALGAALGTLAHEWVTNFAMFPPVMFLLWIIFQDVTKPIAEIEPSDLVADLGLSGIDPRLAVFQVRHDGRRRGNYHRMPSLMNFVDRLSPEIRVAILDLSGVTQIDENTVLEMSAVLTHMHNQNRHLVLSGISAAHYRQLAKVVPTNLFSPHNACPDLELAIARGINLLPALPAPTSPGMFGERPTRK